MLVALLHRLNEATEVVWRLASHTEDVDQSAFRREDNIIITGAKSYGANQR
jgi:hypothetical protein